MHVPIFQIHSKKTRGGDDVLKKAVSLFLCILLIACGILPVYADVSDVVALVPPPDTPHASAAYVYHLGSGTIMLAKNVESVRFPASTVKIMSGLIACRLADGLLNNQITITAQMLEDVGGRNLKLEPGELVTVQDMLYAAFCGGYNDAVSVLAYTLCGSIEAFVEQMNREAAALGATQTVYTNPTGLHDDAMVTTASDTAKISIEASKNSLFMQITSAVKYKMPASERTIHNRNSLISTANGVGYVNSACKGMNAGETDEGGLCCVTVAERDGERYLCLVMGAEDDMIPSKNDPEKFDYVDYSYQHINELADWACDSFTTRQVLEAGQATIKIPVENTGLFGLEIDVCAKESLSVFLPREATDDQLDVRCHLNQTHVDAPVKAGQVVGVITVRYKDTILGSVDAVILEDHARNPIMNGIALLSDYVTSRAFVATAICAVLLITGYFFYVYSGLAHRPKRGKYTRRR